MAKQQANTAAVYCRLSRDDNGEGESNSIVTQRQMLRRYAAEQGFLVYDEYIDDGYSGTSFDRPAFKRMIRDIEDGRVAIVLCKDLSRLGRNNALVAHYTELYFPENDIRFIAVSDAIDTFRDDNEIMPFKSVVNEYYARDISRKVRAGYRNSALNGKFSGSFAPYGYRKDPDDPHRLLVDGNTASVAKRIYGMAADGMTPSRIARQLSDEGIPTPRRYTASQSKKAYHIPLYKEWSATTVLSILHHPVYLGHMVCGRETKKSFKSKKIMQVPEDQWIVTPNTHEPLVGQELFDTVQKLVNVKKRENLNSHANMFTGLLKCADCGGGLGFYRKQHQVSAFSCNRYRRDTKARYCTAHHISYDALYNTVLKDIRRHAQIAKRHEGDLTEYAQRIADSQADDTQRLNQAEIDAARARHGELDRIIGKMLEQNALSVITDERFRILAAGYENEQYALSERITELQSQIDQRDAGSRNTMKFLNATRRYWDITDLNAAILNDLVDSIVIYEPAVRYSKVNRIQRVDIHYKFIGTAKLPRHPSQ